MTAEKHTCDQLYNLLGTVGVSTLLLITEIMPFIKSVKGNGVIHSIIVFLTKKKEDEEHERDPLNSGSGEV